MTDAELLSLLQFNVRWTLRTLPASLGSQGELQHLLGLYAGIEAGEVVETGTLCIHFDSSKPALMFTADSQPSLVVRHHSSRPGLVVIPQESRC